MKTEKELTAAVNKYGDLVLRLCLIHLKNKSDSDDIFQEVFLRYYRHNGSFESDEHEKAWIIRVTNNACKDLLRNFFHSRTVSIDEIGELQGRDETEYREVFEAVLSLPEKNREVVYLHYYEGYKAKEIASILKMNVNTVYTLLTRSKEMLKGILINE